MKKIVFFIAIISMMVAFTSCRSSKEVAYFQNVPNDTIFKNVSDRAITIQPDDKLSIFVKSRDFQLSQMFNLVIGSTVGAYDNSQSSRVYSVDSKGDIEFPAIGKIHVADKTREEVAEYIKKELQKDNQVKDPTIIVEFKNLYYSVTGEVNNPGRYEINKDHVTIMEAIAAAGDLTIQGKRKNVMVMRKEGPDEKIYHLDLTNATDILNSPAYQIRQNDVIYVQPNKMRSRQTTVNGNTALSAGFWVSVASLLISIGVLIFK